MKDSMEKVSVLKRIGCLILLVLGIPVLVILTVVEYFEDRLARKS